MKNRKNTRKRVAAVATGAALTFIVGGVAFAYWTTSGSGTGSAATGSTVPLTINSAPVTGLFPGATAKPITGTFGNTNAGSVHVSGMTVTVSAVSPAQADSAKPACTAADFTVVNPTTFTADVPVGATVGTWSGASIALNNTAANQDNCKNVTLTLALASN